MVMFYFSGTGNSKYIAELFCKEMDAACRSIEDKDADFGALIDDNETIGFCYPIYLSRVPRIMREFALKHMERLKNKKLIIFCTQMVFSGDGARAFCDIFLSGHAEVIYAEHFSMPNNMLNYPGLITLLLAPSKGKIGKCVRKAEKKMREVCHNIKSGIVKKRGFNIVSRILGLVQGVSALSFERKAKKAVFITGNCNACGLCAAICPMGNLRLENGKIVHNNNCAVCYRCINKCPQKAISVIFNGKIKKQYKGLGEG